MASANTPLEFTGDERATAGKLAFMMKAVATVLLLLAGISVVGGVLTLLTVSPAGLLSVFEGLITGLLGLIMLASSANVRFMGETKFAAIHLGHAFSNLTMFYKVQFFLALLLTLITVVRLFTA
jgi:hypothetical protein